MAEKKIAHRVMHRIKEKVQIIKFSSQQNCVYERLRTAICKAVSLAKNKERKSKDEEVSTKDEENDENNEDADSDNKENNENNATAMNRRAITARFLLFKDVENSLQTFSFNGKQNI